MISFFFYNKLTNTELIKKINNNFEILDGYIIIENYNRENNVLEINDNLMNNNKLLYGKIVKFNMNLDDIIKKINKIEECRLENRTKYTLTTIWANKQFGGTYKTYIIY
jgi:hypothetical protein